ncbi:MAG: MBL fold metallo-hydrolase [Chloroflexi bacterium]|nr:MBL fold metallo-hydrolase [Chloroflexota bacterium]
MTVLTVFFRIRGLESGFRRTGKAIAYHSGDIMTLGSNITFGSVSCVSVCAGRGKFRAEAFFANAPAQDLIQALDAAHLPHGKLDTPFHCLLVRIQGQNILFDTGMSGEDLLEALSEADIDAREIGIVVLSHGHLDHIGGSILRSDAPTLPNARYYLSETDWQHYCRVQTRTGHVLKTLGSLVERFEPPIDLAPGIRLLAAPGHTAGQIIGEISTGDHTLIYTADVIAHPLHITHPEWHIVSDEDPAQSTLTRHRLLAHAADTGCLLHVYHFQDPQCRIGHTRAEYHLLG